MINASRRSTCCAVLVDASKTQVARETTPVCTRPLAITSMPAIVITPALLRPAASSSTGAIPRIAARISTTKSASSGSTLPEAIAISVAMTRPAAT